MLLITMEKRHFKDLKVMGEKIQKPENLFAIYMNNIHNLNLSDICFNQFKI